MSSHKEDKMPNHKRVLLLGMGSALLIAVLLFTVSPLRSGTAYAATNAAVTFANGHWSCKTAACTSTVTAGSPQPDYECAEFVARSLAAEGFMPGLTSSSPQGDFDPYHRTGFKHTYDLLLITPTAGLYTLADYLKDEEIATSIGTSLSDASPGDMVVFEDSGGTAHHTALIISVGSTSTTKVDAHNDARSDYALSNYFSEFPKWYMLHFSSGVGGCAIPASGDQSPLICSPGGAD